MSHFLISFPCDDALHKLGNNTCELNKFCVYQQHNLLRRSAASNIYIYMSASVCSKILVMLLLIHLLFVLSLFAGGCDWSLFCYALLSGLSLLQSSDRGRNSWLLYFNCLLAVERLWCSVSLPWGVVGWAELCNCGISWPYLYTVWGKLHMIVFSLCYFIYASIVIITLSH